jgi:hypothetical protein
MQQFFHQDFVTVHTWLVARFGVVFFNLQSELSAWNYGIEVKLQEARLFERLN